MHAYVEGARYSSGMGLSYGRVVHFWFVLHTSRRCCTPQWRRNKILFSHPGFYRNGRLKVRYIILIKYLSFSWKNNISQTKYQKQSKNKRLEIMTSKIQEWRPNYGITLPEHLNSPPGLSGDSCYSIISFMCMFCRSLFVLF